jgi:hypothetical protein
LKERRKGRKDKEEDVSSYWLNLRKREDTGNTRYHLVEIALLRDIGPVVRLRDGDDVFVLTSVTDKGAMLENY